MNYSLYSTQTGIIQFCAIEIVIAFYVFSRLAKLGFKNVVTEFWILMSFTIVAPILILLDLGGLPFYVILIQPGLGIIVGASAWLLYFSFPSLRPPSFKNKK